MDDARASGGSATPAGGADHAGGVARGGGAGPVPADPLLAAAHRLALFYALLSPRILQQELGVERARAEELLEQLAARGVVGPVFIERSRARESLVNMVNAVSGAPGGADLGPGLSLARVGAGRAAIAATLVGVALALAVGLGLLLTGLGLRLADLLGIGAVSPALARLGGLLALPAAAGWGAGALVEALLSPADAATPYRAVQVRRSLWTLYAVAALGAGSLLLFR